MINNRSKKSLNHVHGNSYGGHQNMQIHSQGNHNGVYNPNQEGGAKIKNYYELIEKNRRHEKIQSDLTKIYMVNSVGNVVNQGGQ